MVEPKDMITMNRLLTPAYRQSLEDIVQHFLETKGEKVQGDHLFSEENIQMITQNL